MQGRAIITTDRDEIRRWVESREGRPATLRGSGEGVGILRVVFPGRSRERIEFITWDQFFAKFEEKRLAFLYLETSRHGRPSRFFKLVPRDAHARDEGHGESHVGEAA
jgi:hypothetical protein